MAILDTTSPLLRIVKGVADACISADVEKARQFLSKDYTFKTFPQTAELPDLSREEYIQKYGEIFRSFAKMELDFHEVIEGPGKVVIHFTAQWTAADGTTVENDPVWIETFVEEDGELKLLETKDFSNPQKRDVFLAGAAKAVANAQANMQVA